MVALHYWVVEKKGYRVWWQSAGIAFCNATCMVLVEALPSIIHHSPDSPWEATLLALGGGLYGLLYSLYNNDV